MKNNKGRRNELAKLMQFKRAKNYRVRDKGSFFNKLKHTAKVCSCGICSPGRWEPNKPKHSDLKKSIYID